MSAAEHATRIAAARLSRRTLLRVGAVVVVGATACRDDGPHWHTVPAATPLHALSPRTYATLTAACARIAGPRIANEIHSERLAPGLVADAWLARTPAVRDPLTQALTLLEFGIYPLVAKVRPFTALGPAAQDLVLLDLQGSRLELKRALFGGIRSLALLAVYLTPQAHALIGYPAPFGTATISIADAMAALPPPA